MYLADASSGEENYVKGSRPCIPCFRCLVNRNVAHPVHKLAMIIQLYPFIPHQPLSINERLLRPLGIKYLALLTSRKLDLCLRCLIEQVKRWIQRIFEDANVSSRVQRMPRLDAGRTFARLQDQK